MPPLREIKISGGEHKFRMGGGGRREKGGGGGSWRVGFPNSTRGSIGNSDAPSASIEGSWCQVVFSRENGQEETNYDTGQVSVLG